MSTSKAENVSGHAWLQLVIMSSTKCASSVYMVYSLNCVVRVVGMSAWSSFPTPCPNFCNPQPGTTGAILPRYNVMKNNTLLNSL